MLLPHDAVFFLLLVAACKWHRPRIFHKRCSSEIDFHPNCSESLMRLEKIISDYSRFMIVNTEPPTPDETSNDFTISSRDHGHVQSQTKTPELSVYTYTPAGRSDIYVSNYSSSSTEPTTVKSMGLTTKSPRTDPDDYPMLRDDPGAYDTDGTSNRSTPDYGTDSPLRDSHAKTPQVLNRFGDINPPERTSNVFTISPGVFEHVKLQTTTPELSVYTYRPAEKSDIYVSNYSSSFTGPKTVKSMKLTTNSPRADLDDYSMLGDDPSAYDTDRTSNRSTVGYGTDSSLSDFKRETTQGKAFIPFPTKPSIPDRSSVTDSGKMVTSATWDRSNDINSVTGTPYVPTTSSRIDEGVQSGTPPSPALSFPHAFDPDVMLGDDPSTYVTVETFRYARPTETPIQYSLETTSSEREGTSFLSSRFPGDKSSGEISKDVGTSMTKGNHSLSEILNPTTQSQSTDTSAEKAMRDAFHNFIMNYSTVILGDYENIITYPISIADLMLLSSYGACFCTLETIDTMLNLSHAIRYDLGNIKSFMNKHSISTDGILVDQRMFITSNVELAKRFSGIARRVFKSNLQQINFDRCEEASEIINNWCANRTRNVITNVVNADQFNNQTDMVLVSVASINCSWLKPFDPNLTKQEEFLVNGIYKTVWMMNLETHCRQGILRKLNNSTYVELFIAKTSVENPMRMIIILPPEESSLSKIVPKLLNFKLKDLDVDNDENALVNISLPKFKIRTKVNLKDYKEAMGLDNIFSDVANFKHITKSRYLKLHDFIQSSVIDVNEGNYHNEGTMSAQISKVNSSEICKIFRVNRPFIILIANNNTVFASAQIVDPTL